MELSELIFVTGNLNKVREAEQKLGIKLNHTSIDLHELQEVDVECVVKHKAKTAFEQLCKPVIVEDVSLGFKAFNGYPGALIKWHRQYVTTKNICKILNGFDRTAIAKCAICIFDEKEYRVFVGETKGQIIYEEKGISGFGFDPIFQPDGCEKTFAEMILEEKNKISHRAKAWEKVKKHIII